MSTTHFSEFKNIKFDGGVGGNGGRVGVVTLATDQTIEYDLSSVLHPLGIGCHYSRIQMDDKVTPETLYNMLEKIGDSAKLLLPNKKMNVLTYACTSASATIGEDKIFHQLSKRQEDAFKTTPITAVLEAFKALKVTRIGLVTPYVGEVNDILIKYIQSSGPYEVTRLITFNLIHDSDVASVSCDSIKEAAVQVGQHGDVDTVFISCTSLRTKDVCVKVEKIIHKPVISSNIALAWHIIRLVKCHKDISSDYGLLFSKLLK